MSEEVDKHVLRKYEVLQKLGRGVSFHCAGTSRRQIIALYLVEESYVLRKLHAHPKMTAKSAPRSDPKKVEKLQKVEKNLKVARDFLKV